MILRRACRCYDSMKPLPPFGGAVGDWLTFGVAQKPTRKAEDCFIIAPCASEGDTWCDLLAAVLDGHNGRNAAEAVASRLVATIREELASLAPDEKAGPPPPAHDAASPNWHPQARCDFWRAVSGGLPL